jgi:PAB1-binding protein PBP1
MGNLNFSKGVDLSKNRDLYSGSHRDRRRLHLNRLREKEHREEERRFKETSFMQQKFTSDDSSQIREDIARLAARIIVAEAALVEAERNASRSSISLVSAVALIVSLATLAVVVWTRV